jgi:phage terminase large subunit-like protein
VFNSAKAERVVRIVSLLFKSIDLELPAFERELITRLYGVTNANGFRQYRRCYFSIPRKNSKTTLAAALCLYHLFYDDEPLPRVYIAATSLDQTRETFEILALMCSRSKYLNSRTKVHNSINRKEVIRLDENGAIVGYIQALTQRGSKEGKNASVVIFDELCDFTASDIPLWRSMTKGSKTRKQPLFFITTTAGMYNEGLCFDQYQHAKDVQADPKKDDSFLPFIIEADPDKWDDPDEWRRVNPLVAEGFVDFSALEEEWKQAQVSPSELATFKRKTLNIWCGSDQAYLDIAAWTNQTETFDDSTVAGLPCYVSLDLSKVHDFTSFVCLWPQVQPDGTRRYYVKPFFFLPSHGIMQRAKKDGQDYDGWIKSGLLTICQGPTIDLDQVADRIIALKGQYNIHEIAFDSWNAPAVVKKLNAAGFLLTEASQSIKAATVPMKELQALVSNRRIIHSNNPILQWQAENLQAKEDANGNVQPNKKPRTRMIDGMVALIMALGTAMRHENNPKRKSALGDFVE